ncbi:acyl-CoA thioesterase [Spongiibacter taiwanensis]|uniref:acyl-CoA thioesterase n=1 Tax=Spongiibacter taiwanensis TaxID=1748242 RepID=UPI002035BE34|nr:thioesterase family protein [Spongiibacter taiwanensis]USA44705.1 acyl-CoA thioesterase [Spongiibacter taiwanensis]
MTTSDIAPLFAVEIKPRWADQDPFGHINHVAYFRYLEEARVAWLLADPIAAISNEGDYGLIIAHTSLNYRREWHHPNALLATGHVLSVGSASVKLRQQLLEPENGQVVADGDITLVWMNLRSRASEPLPAAAKQKLLAHLLPEGV